MNLEKPFPTKGHRCSHCFKNGIETVLSQLNSKNQLQSTGNFSFIILLVYTAHWKLHDHTQLSRLLAVATPDTCFFFSLFPHRSHVSCSLFFFVRCPRSLWHYATLISSFNNNNNNNTLHKSTTDNDCNLVVRQSQYINFTESKLRKGGFTANLTPELTCNKSTQLRDATIWLMTWLAVSVMAWLTAAKLGRLVLSEFWTPCIPMVWYGKCRFI